MASHTLSNHDADAIAKPIGLIGGIGLTEVHVYDQRPAPDGKQSGCPHVHALTDEAYYVLRGSGKVELHDLKDGYRTLPLKLGDYMHFPPNTMHRLINDGGLVILGVMGNAGLPEAGDARIYFGPDVDADEAEFKRLVSLPKAGGLEGALDRRDASVSAYLELCKLWDTDRDAYFAELERYFKKHGDAIGDEADHYEDVIRRGPVRWGDRVLERLDSLRQGTTRDESSEAGVELNEIGDDEALGMCGVLRPMVTLKAVDQLHIKEQT